MKALLFAIQKKAILLGKLMLRGMISCYLISAQGKHKLEYILRLIEHYVGEDNQNKVLNYRKRLNKT